MAKTVKVGVIGLGWPGHEQLKGLRTCKNAEVAAVCDLDAQRVEEMAATYEIPRKYADYKDLLRDGDIDAVSVCLPNFLHKPITVAALKAGKHVICEKPPALNAREAQAMAKAAEAAGKHLMYALVLRFQNSSRLVRQFVDSGELGEIYFAKAGYVRRRGIPVGKGGWFVDKSRSGGGALIDIGVHALDRAWWLMGSPKPVAVSGATFSKFAHTIPKGIKYDVDDAAFGIIKFENGAALILEATWALNLKGGSYLEIAGTKGGAQLTPLTIYTERDGVPMDVTPAVQENNAFEAETHHFIECILQNKEPISSAQQGVELMKMLDGIYKSGETGKEAKL